MRRIRTVTEILACLSLVLGAITLRAEDDQAITKFESLIKADKLTEVSSALESYTAVHPQSWQALYQLGYVDFRLHRIRQSLTMVCKSLVLNPKFAESHKILAYDLNILGRQDLAIGELRKAIGYDPKSAESHYELGRIYYEEGSYVKAIQNLETAKFLAPGFVRVYHNLGLAYSAIADTAKAVENFEAGLRLNAQQQKPSAWPLIDYATYFNMQENFDKARDLSLRAIRIDDSWDQEYGELAKAYRGLNQTGEAIEALKRAIVLNPRKAEYHYVLARLYMQTHQLDQAKEQLAEYQRQKGPETN
jgi:tetratricopeptide (TPR) repeat protein